MAYQGLQTNFGLSDDVAKRHERGHAQRATALDGLTRYAEIERSQIPGQMPRQSGMAGIAMAGQAIGQVIEKERLAREQAERAKNTAPIIQGTDVDWGKAFQSEPTFDYTGGQDWSPSSWTGGSGPQSTNSFSEMYDPAIHDADTGFKFGEGIDWSKTAFGS